MNRTSLSVIALAVGAVLIIGLYNVYKPQTKGLVDKVFHKVNTSLHDTQMGLKVHHYDGLSYTNDHGNVEFTDGTLNNSDAMNWRWPGHSFLGRAPQDVQKAKSIKFDDNVDVSNVHNMWGMFSEAPNLQSVSLGNNFDTHNVEYQDGTKGLDCMFASDPNLKSVDLGQKFTSNDGNIKTNNVGNVINLFGGDPKLQTLSGHIPNSIQQNFNER